MPETVRALIVILAVGSVTIHFLGFRLSTIISFREYRQWQLLWVIAMITAFLSPNYWFFIVVLIISLKVLVKGNAANKFATYAWLLLILPMLQKDIPGFAGINVLFQLDYPRILALTVLLPLFLSHSNRQISFLRLPGDKFLALFLIISILIAFRNGSVTNIIRTDLYIFLDIFLPYFVASRSLHNLNDFKKVALAIFFSVSILASFTLIEAIKGWHLYGSLQSSLQTLDHVGSNQYRDGFYRTTGPFSSPIVLGYVLVIGLGMIIAIQSSFQSTKRLFPFILTHIIALISTVSRGPWVGAMILIGSYILLSKNRTKLLSRIFIVSFLSSPLLLFTSFGQKIINLLPFIGESNEGSIGYRQELLEKSWIVIKQHPFLGSNTYLQTPEMQSMIQGEGIIDIVNSYIRIALDSGLLGLSSFIIFFLVIMLRLYKTLKKLPSNDIEVRLFGISILSLMISILIIIATVSSVDRISHLYWMLAGMITAFQQFLKKRKLNEST